MLYPSFAFGKLTIVVLLHHTPEKKKTTRMCCVAHYGPVYGVKMFNKLSHLVFAKALIRLIHKKGTDYNQQ